MLRIICLLGCFGMMSEAVAQIIVNMSNGSTTACEGVFMDSDAGQPAGYYGHNENLTYTICVPTAQSLTLTFSEFCTEPTLDYLQFYDGPTAASPLIGGGPFSGNNVPPAIVASSGCLTITFTTDANVACSGWVAEWEAEMPDPLPPIMSFSPIDPTCSTASAMLTFSYPIPCDSVNAGAFQIEAPNALSIANITPINCVNNQATQYQLTFSPGMNESGIYSFDFVYRYVDPCDRLWILNSEAQMEVNDCPLILNLTAADNPICPNTCTQLIAEVSGGTGPGTYTYLWSAGVTGSGDTVNACITQPTTYTLTVDDQGPAAAATAVITLQTLEPAIAQPDVTLCANAAPIQLTATPLGGEWSGVGVTNPQTAQVEPWAEGGNPRYIVYTAPNGCQDSVFLNVLPIWAGPDEASCPGANDFQLSNPSPAGGSWSGPNVTVDGLFSPAASGTYSLTYLAPNGCSDDKWVNVDVITLPNIDTICRSEPLFNLQATPFGGNWSGSGIVNGYWGEFNAADASVGNISLTYAINGCSSVLDVFIKDIAMPQNFTVCPATGTFTMPPATPTGGTWNGAGIINLLTGLYNPGILPSGFNDAVLYTVDGCTDTVLVRIRTTEVQTLTLQLCPTEEAFSLSFGSPQNGTWSGVGVYPSADTFLFSGVLSGSGQFYAVYAANGCSDSTLVDVRPSLSFTDTSICTLGEPFLLSVNEPGGIWGGNGIVDENTGLFDPGAADVGIQTLYYQSPLGCLDSFEIEITDLASVSFDSLDPIYCYQTSANLLVPDPVGGIFSGPGMVQDTFIPSLAGPGAHVITYTYGYGTCQFSATRNVLVRDSIRTQWQIASDSVCYGEEADLSIIANGGYGDLTYAWSNSSTTDNDLQFVATNSLTVQVITSDGCSDDAIDSVFVYVHPPIEVAFTTSPTLCYAQEGFATVRPAGNGQYSYWWENASPSGADSVTARVGYDYRVQVTDTQTGCRIDTVVRIPGFGLVQAFFTPNPDGGCVPITQPLVGFIDLSTGAVEGVWDFGDGNSAPYSNLSTPENTYLDTGEFTVTLVVSGEGGCTDTFSLPICVAQELRLFVPEAFTPNADGPAENEVFKVYAIGLSEFKLKIYNRWGQVIKELNSVDEVWDGTYNGKPVQAGMYVWDITAKGLDKGRIKYIYQSGKIYLAR